MLRSFAVSFGTLVYRLSTSFMIFEGMAMSLPRNLLKYECSCDEGCVYYVCAGLTWLKVQEGGNKALAAHVRPIKWLANALAYRFTPIRNKFLLSYLMKVYNTFKSTRVSHNFTHAWMEKYYEVATAFGTRSRQKR